mmetsp:Transcript_35989/g.84580  ORF Transcript_35989/g.84580 Transcript_35989/m.84580 type:complete len:372 (-) Transcript_35989:349-1464(-)
MPPLERRNSFSRIRRGNATYAPQEISSPKPADEPAPDENTRPPTDKPATAKLVRSGSFGRIRKANIPAAKPSAKEEQCIVAQSTAAAGEGAPASAAASAAAAGEGAPAPTAAPALAAQGILVRSAAEDAQAGDEVYESDFEELEEEEWVPLTEVDEQLKIVVREEKARAAQEISELRRELAALREAQVGEHESIRLQAGRAVHIVQIVREAAAAELAAAVGCARKAAMAEAARVDALRDELAAARATCAAESARADALRAELDAMTSVHARASDAFRAIGLPGVDTSDAGCSLCGGLDKCCLGLRSPSLRSPGGDVTPSCSLRIRDRLLSTPGSESGDAPQTPEPNGKSPLLPPGPDANSAIATRIRVSRV